ncbi:hypothetical protein IDJ77_15280 [Mucilaginibacter sp. ZT4R22]|uniref:Uncharacterized protein n=1 Tax=Mucilaginibacter pankratovii TaxID=2772110 RepID=A0ABR7WVA8_9SPHI|nr:hypothetical protein [Mucilaginibacter pankratovii]MBD1365177.1 hypothetical protein [Mucilaginibacter pankratovii]
MHHADLSNSQFLHQIETVTINPELFTHEAHIRMAWLYLNGFNQEMALQHISTAIKGIDAKYAGGMKFHHTITVVFANKIAALMQHKAHKSWQEFVAANAGLGISKKFLSNYYSDELLYSDKAKTQFVSPDKKPLPAL